MTGTVSNQDNIESLSNDSESIIENPRLFSGFCFPKQNRLLNAKAFSPVFDNPPFRGSDRYFLILAKPNDSGISRLGIVVAKKNVRFAVDRNRFKRRVRESFRLKQHQLPPIDAIVLARRGVDKIPNTQFQKTLDKLWKRVAKQVAMKNNENPAS